MAFRYLDKDGALSFWTNIKNYILSKIPTKTSELTNDSGYLTSHQSLANYVTTNTAQDIEGNKNFKGLLTTIPDGTIWPVTASTTDDITYLGANAIHVEQKGSGKLTDLSGGAWSVAELGLGCFFFRINNGADIRYKNFAQNTVNRIPVVSGANRFINDVTPNEDNTYSLGTSSLRWSSCYCNAYYLGTTAFGDIVTHNASEFLASNGKAVEANKVQATIAAGTTAALVQGNIASNDCFRIAAGGAANAGWAEIATGDDANEPIYVRQYKGSFTTLQRTATLLDGSGNTSFPGTVTATGFSGPLTGNVTGNASSATRTQINRSDISSDITLSDTNTYRGMCLNCTNNLTINVPSLNSALCWFIIKNVTDDKSVTIHPTTSVTIDGSNNDIVLRPKESITILSRSSNNFVIINDNRRRTALVGRTVAVTGATKHWFLVAETTVSINYANIYASFKVFKASGTYQASGILSLFVRVDSTRGVSSNRQLQWEYNNDTSTLPLEKFVITTTETSGDNIKVQLWYKDEGSYASCKFIMLAEQDATEYLDIPIWKLTRFRKTTADGDMETLDTGFTTTTYSSLMSIVNPIPAIDTCVKNSVTNNQIIKSTAITRGTAPSSKQIFGITFSDNNGKQIGNVYGQYATDKSTHVGLYAYKGTTTADRDNVAVRVGYDASGNAYTYAPTPATADNSTQIATTAFVKAQGYLTSHQSLANYVTTNTDQSISGIKSHSKHISILGDYIGNELSTNARTCLYLKSNRDTDGKSGIYFSKYRQNRAQGALTGSDLVSFTLDVLENSVRTNNCISVDFRYFEKDIPTKIYVAPKASMTSYMGTAGNPWTNAYITNLNLNGNAFDPTSVSGNIGDIVFASAYYSSIAGTADLGLTVSGNDLYLACFDNNTLVIDSSTSSLPGTWKFLGRGKPTTTSGNADTKRVGLWKRIA